MRAPVVTWALRLCWLALPFTVGEAVSAAVAGRSTPVGITTAVMAWVVWGAVLLASVVTLPATLTVLRVAVPVAPVAAVAATTLWSPADPTTPDLTLGIVGAALAVVATGCALSGALADFYVDAASYGDERRFALRVPVRFAAGPIPVFWLLLAGGLTVGPLLVAARQWIVGALVTAVGLAVAAPAVRSFHALSRRWLVFVPAGVTLIDHLALVDPVLLPKRRVVRIGPAFEDTDATDYTQETLGLVLEIALDSPVEVVERTARAAGELATVSAVLVGPCRPGAVVAEATRRGLPTGTGLGTEATPTVSG